MVCLFLWRGDRLIWQNAQIAQAVEHILGKDEVIGSIPIASSTTISLTLAWYERHHHARVHGVQTPELHDDQEQEEAVWSRRVQEILRVVQQAHPAQGNQVASTRQ